LRVPAPKYNINTLAIAQARDILPGAQLPRPSARKPSAEVTKPTYRSIFDLFSDLSFTTNGSSQQNQILRRYFKLEVNINDDMGMKALPQN